MSSNIKIQKICEFCGQEFTARTLYTRYCSKSCNKKHYKQLLLEKNLEIEWRIECYRYFDRVKFMTNVAQECIENAFLHMR